MKRGFILLIFAMLFPILSLTAHGQEIYVPPFSPESPLQISSSRKNVALSTDIITIALPVSTLVGVMIDKDWEGLKQGIYTAAATTAATLILKYSVYETRPNFKNSHSFPSGHTSVTFATAAFLQRRYGWAFGVPAYALATYTAWGRVFSKNHHWWDCVAGAAIGAGSAYLFTRPKLKKLELSITPVSDGIHHGFAACATF